MASTSSRAKYPSTIANGKFEITKRLGAGCFGEVYRAIDTETREEVAVKFEDAATRYPQLEREAQMLASLTRPMQQQGIAELFYFGKEGKSQCLVMSLLGKSLEDRVQMCSGRLSTKTTTLVAEQALGCIEYIHSRGVLHRDIKPENFMFGVGEKQHHLYMIDFGLSKTYYAKRHVRMQTGLSLTGTARYASINAHRGVEQSRRDDLEAIGHMFLYFLRGSLPWSGLSAKTKEEKYKKIKETKESVSLTDLCRGYPGAFERYLTYSRSLGFKDRPKYVMLRTLFGDLRATISREEGRQVHDHEFEWNVGEEADKLEPLAPLQRLVQPDDLEDPPMQSRRCSCFCAKSLSAIG